MSESQEAEMEDEESGDDYDPYDVEELVAASAAKIATLDRQRLQNDFIETIATNYRPGFIRFGGDDFSVSMSLPITELADSIPPRALMAWDRRLLSRSQHLTLLISNLRGVYPPLGADGTYTSVAHRLGTALTFQVGLTSRYKPGKDFAKDAARTFGLILQDAEDDLRIQAEKAAALEIFEFDYNSDHFGEAAPPALALAEDEPEDEGRFDRFSLSSALESLMDQAFLKVVQLRRKFKLGWAGAELLLSDIERTQKKSEDIYQEMQNKFIAADKEERELTRTTVLPHDPLLDLGKNDGINLPLTAFCYLIRRLSLCTRYCIVCHNRLANDYEALKPYVCDSKLCAYQYYSLNRGPSLEYEIIHNPQTVDLLVSIAHSAATEGVIEDPLPVGMGLRVPQPDSNKIPPVHNHRVMPGFAARVQVGPASPAPAPQREFTIGSDGLGDFDDLSLPLMRVSISEMIDSLPPIDDMKKHLERKVKAGKSKPKLKDLDPNVLPAAWSILRWCVASCTSYLEEITSGDERVHGLDPAWRQFRFSVGAPDAEAKFKASVRESQATDKNAQQYPSLYAFHGSALKNWHSIIRHGLWYRQVTNGRAYGDGVYLAKEGSISMGTYAQSGRSTWSKSKICPTNCVALAEVVNLPFQFVSHNPYFVIKDTHWIMCRYLLVKGMTEITYDAQGVEIVAPLMGPSLGVPLVNLDPKHPVTLSNRAIQIPEPSYQIDALLQARTQEYERDENDDEDFTIFAYTAAQPEREVIEVHDDDDDDGQFDLDDDDDYNVRPSKAAPSKGKARALGQPARPADDWKHDPEWVNNTVENLMPPPVDSTPSATMAVQRELRAMLKEQESAKSLKELGWYMPPDLVGDNLFQWIVEMHSFDETLPIAKDMRARNLNSIIFEIRFPPSFPIAPPFFRIITPRFLPFIHGGGGHVTGGGSICMDLLTSDGWLPSYNISSILLQIKLAISNLDPRPARLASNFHQPYEVHEALTGYKRAAATHGWQVPVGIDKLVR
ncbi:hypothetical protein BDZ94DRAFT_1262434 [Collybia nuda]|uniref:UBC core domain-containing protein n=1 Tax=Collybia nuda TaxID=64659 RepID=A0A9P6CDK5_9AGAR|nr:hypothetical protein BDZ94DRAFT_1262434 [Collybia nuda]